MMYADGNVGLAFALVIGAGMATCIGSCLVFCTSLANSRLLAGSLGLSSGVMLYVSFAEIFSAKSVAAFEEHYADDPNGEGKALRMATFCFFGGMACIAALNWVVHLLEKLANPPPPRASIELATATPVTSGASVKADAPEEDIGDVSINGSVVLSVTPDAESSRRCLSNEAVRAETGARNGDTELTVPDNVKEIMDRDDHHAGLNKMGIMTGLAIAIHNFPEGLATFVAALAEPKAGAALAIAIALHNIPEGICVAMPVYYATGSKWKGFFWSFLSGVTEPIGGVVGYLILWNSVTPLTYAIMFGLVGGMMVYISLRDLLPTALRYDPEDRITTLCLFLGMVVMAASLLVFTV